MNDVEKFKNIFFFYKEFNNNAIHWRGKVEFWAESMFQDLMRFLGTEASKANYFIFDDCLLKGAKKAKHSWDQ